MILGSFIKIRLLQIYRSSKGVGIFRLAFLVAILFFFGLGIYSQTNHKPYVYYITGVFLFIIGIIHNRRKDKLFLKTNFKTYRLIYFIEYLILLMPLIVCLLIHYHIVVAVFSLSILVLIINLDFKLNSKTLNSNLQLLIPSESFEWKAGIRRTLVVIVPAWVISFFTSFFIGSVPAFIFLFGIISWDFYERGEPLDLILCHELGTHDFLNRKIKNQILQFSIPIIPLLVLFFIFHTQYWYIPVIEYSLFISSHIFLVFTKYAFYIPNEKSAGSQTYGAIGAICCIIPIFTPVIWLLTIRFYIKSKENLNFFLNDYN